MTDRAPGDAGHRRILCLDVGSRRIGVAMSDLLGLTAQPLPMVERDKGNRWVSTLTELVREHDIQTLVVGWPLTMEGREGPAVRRVRRFLDQLLPDLGDIELVTWDERFSTAQAERTLIHGNVRRAQRKQVVDSMAASLILQSYLGSQP